MHTVVGRPIKVNKTPQPSEEEVNTTHKLYVEELERIWKEYQPQYSADVGEMKIVE